MTSTNQDTQQMVIDALAFAYKLADDVAECLLGHFGSVRNVEVKGDGTWVTPADLEADHLIADAIRRQYPDHDVVSEELNPVYTGAPWCWIIDPIDGTTNFAQGVPIWAVSIALAFEGWPAMGLIDFPTLGIRYHALKGAGAFENSQPIGVKAAVDLGEPESLENELFAVCTRTTQHFRLDVPMKLRIMGSAAYNFCLAAAGVAVASLDMTPKVWDMAAGWLLVREAGGVVTQLEGEPMFPLVAGRDYESIFHPQLSAPGESIARELIQRLKPLR
jgi:myo-inositol-1(or 4)-monophosphatase